MKSIRSLREYALDESTKDFPDLESVVRFCKNKDVCDNAPEFWKNILQRFLGSIIVLQRGDIKDSDWYEFAKALVASKSFTYSMVHDKHADRFHGPYPYYATADVKREEKLENRPYIEGLLETKTYVFQIPGVIPQKDTIGVFFRMEVMGENNCPLFEHNDFVVADTYEKATFNAYRCIVALFIKSHKLVILNPRYSKWPYYFYEGHDELEEARPLRNFPTEDFLLKRLLEYEVIFSKGRVQSFTQWHISFGPEKRRITTKIIMTPIIF